MPEAKKTTITPEQIADFLKQTGFVFEMRVNEQLSKLGYKCEISSTFLDLEGDTEREIDIIASKRINDIDVHLVIECKQSLLDKWVFICNKNDSRRYYYALKHLPKLATEDIDKLFLGFHVFDRGILLAHNFICYSLVAEKKGDHRQIDECILKLPKALIDTASRVGPGRHLFFPIGLFSGQVFAVRYEGSLIVEEMALIHYAVLFESEAYEHSNEGASTEMSLSFGGRYWKKEQRSARNQALRETARKLSVPYQIDFVTESGLSEYIAMMEKEVAGIRTADWPLPASPAEVAQAKQEDAKP